MSGPIPAGSPSVSARGDRMRVLLAVALRIFDQGLAAQLLQVSLRLLLEFLIEQGFARLLLVERVIGLGGVLAADREHLDAEFGDLRGGQLADRNAVETLAQL